MAVRNHRLRFMANNFVNSLTSAQYTYSSQLTAFPFTNTQKDIRSSVWKTSGFFEIVSTNSKIYINDGEDRTVTLATSATAYTTPALMASHVQTQLNASSSGWTVSYSTTTYKFTIANAGSFTLRLSVTTDAAWSTLGYTTSIDLTAASFVADSVRIHTSEYVIYDLGADTAIDFFACIGVINETFPISSSATVKIQGNNINSFSAPPIDLTVTVNDGGLFKFMDDQASTTYRYWKFSFIDKTNSNGPETFDLSHIYLGSYTDFAERVVGHGYNKTVVDPSTMTASENGTLYFDDKFKYTQFSNLQFRILTRADKDDLEALYYKVGKRIPFYVSIDPLLSYTDNLDELTRFVRFSEGPSFSHEFRDMFTTSIIMVEVV